MRKASICASTGWKQTRFCIKEMEHTAATNAFLPLFSSSAEAIQAQFETAASVYRRLLGSVPRGTWLPEMGWSPALDRFLRAYLFGYTLVDTHAALLGSPTPVTGTFRPFRTPGRTVVLGRDITTRRALSEASRNPVYRDNMRCEELVVQGKSEPSVLRYYSGEALYYPEKAASQAEKDAASFLEAARERLSLAHDALADRPVMVCAWDIEELGRQWHEGTLFLEALLRQAAQADSGVDVMSPEEYLFNTVGAHPETGGAALAKESLPVSMPAFSSWSAGGYGGTWLDAKNDWIYRHLICAIDRMVDLAGRFPYDNGVRGRALNQAAREVLLAQDAVWPRFLNERPSSSFAGDSVSDALCAFTSIYEALGSGRVSIGWLTDLEKRHNFFPRVNYRVFQSRL